MTPEERQMLGGLFQRVNAAAATQRDAEAESFINDAVRAAPHAPYVLAQTVLVQQQALEAAANHISQLEAAARRAPTRTRNMAVSSAISASPFSAAAPPPLRPGRSLTRRPISARAPPPPRGYAPPPSQGGYPPPPPQGYPPQPGPWGQPQASGGGGGFLQNAASTATGVAGGVVLGNLLGGLFGGHGGGASLWRRGERDGVRRRRACGDRPEMTEINNYYGDRPDAGSDANFQQFDPGAPGVQDANFDNLDDFDLRRLGRLVLTTAAATTTSDGCCAIMAKRVRSRLAGFYRTITFAPTGTRL